MHVQRDKQTLIETDDEGAAPAKLRMVVFLEDGLTTRALPESGSVVIGRGEDCDIQLDLQSISRQHARLHLGPPLQLEDLGSSNGTKARGEAVRKNSRVTLRHTDTFELGSVLVLLQPERQSSSKARPRRVTTHDYFETRVEEECARAASEGSQPAVLRIRVERAGADVAAAISAELPPSAVLAIFGPKDYEVLLPGVLGATAADVSAAIEKKLPTAQVRVALWGRDGRSPEALLGEATTPATGVASRVNAIIADPQMVALYALVPRIARSNISVLVLGETGVGKELMAEALHRESPRASGPFVQLNCGAIAESLLESELFGHEKGAFTGAIKTRAGLLESATGGTVFLDEVGEMPAATQVKLLRAIEKKEITRVGGTEAIKIDVRFVAATHRDLEVEVKAGRFRQDLYFRLNGISMHLAPLRDRPSELKLLAERFVQEAAERLGRSSMKLAPEAMELLSRYGWPGNIRELRNFMERAVLLAPDDTVTAEELPLEKLSAVVITPQALEKEDTKPQDERNRIIDTLERCAGNQTLAAQQLGISRRTLVTRLDGLGLPRPRKGQR